MGLPARGGLLAAACAHAGAVAWTSILEILGRWPPAAAPRNLEKVWKKEQEADAEKKRVEELRCAPVQASALAALLTLLLRLAGRSPPSPSPPSPLLHQQETVRRGAQEG